MRFHKPIAFRIQGLGCQACWITVKDALKLILHIGLPPGGWASITALAACSLRDALDRRRGDEKRVFCKDARRRHAGSIAELSVTASILVSAVEQDEFNAT